MKTTVLLFLLFVLASCSSVPTTGDKKTDDVIAHVAQNQKIIGEEWQEKFTKDGFIDGYYVAIGSSSTNNVNYNNKPLRLSAESDAMSRLLRSAPTDYKRIVKKVLNSLSDGDGQVSETDIAITEVKALTGITSNFDDIQCIKTVTPTQDMKWAFGKECRMILRVSPEDLSKAYDFTLSRKYSIKRKNEIEELVNKEIANSNEEKQTEN